MTPPLQKLISNRLVQVALLAATYYIAGRFGQLVALPGTQTTPVWPPSGIAQAALLLLGYHVWPGIFIGAFFANVWPFITGSTPSEIFRAILVGLVIGSGSTLQALLGAFLLKRLAGVSNPLGRVRDIFIFVIFSAILACIVSPTFGVTILSLTGFSAWSSYQDVWRTWWQGDVVGVIIFAPLLLSWRKWLALRLQPYEALEAAVLLLVTLGIGQLAFGVGSPVEYMFIPLLLWGAFRFGQLGALSVSLLASGMAVVGTINGIGSFASPNLNESLLSLVAFLAVITVTALVLAAALNEREQAEQELANYTRTLEDRVQERTAGLQRRSVQLQVAAEVARDATRSTQDMDNLLNGAVEMIRARFGFYHAGIFIVDEVGEYAVLRAAASEAAAAMLALGHKLKIGETGIVGNVTATGQPRIALDVGADAVHFKNPHLPNTRSEMALPLKVGEEIIGALDVQSEEEAAFDEEDIATLSTLADQVAIAIQNVRSYARMREVDDLKTRFIANMSHELRTPLNAIINFADFMLKRRFGELTEKQESLQQRIMANGEHLLGLINDILDLSKIEAGKMELMHEEVHLKPLLDGVMSTAVGLTKEKGIELSLQVAPEGLPPVWADETRVRQVMLNLLSNAAKFTPAGGQVTVRAGVQNGHVAVSVIDTGIGIAPEHQALVFEEFRQVDSDLSREYQGTGLGLPICKKLIEMHGGKLTLRSTVGEGSTFTFTLPTMVGEGQKRGVESLLPTPTLSLDGNHRVVVVDDDGDAQTILGHTLEAAGWQVYPVLDSREAYEVVRRVRPHVVVLDLKMPHLDGWAVLNQLRADPSLAGLPIVVCSIVDREQGQMGVMSSVQGWLVKPVERGTLLEQVQKVATTPAQVLVVDDDPDARLVVSSILEQSGWNVAEVSDGTEALAYLEEKQPDLMVLDLMMPHIDGFEVLRRMNIHPDWARIPVLVLTAKDLTKEEQSWLAQHTHGHFQKAAFPITEFPAIVRSLVQYIPPEKA